VLALQAKLRDALAQSAGAKLSPYLAWYWSKAKLGRLRYAFERLVRLAERNRFGVTVLMLPYLDEAGRPELFDLAYSIAAHEAQRQRFRVVDAVRDARVAGLETLRRIGPLHPNARGHAVVAHALARDLGRELARASDGSLVPSVRN
jgi:hypothetical protein